MNDINQFTFFKDYYNVLNELKKEDKRILLEAIVDYIFTDKEPTLTGLNKAIWNLLKRPLDTSKNKSNNAKKDIQNKIKTKSNKNQNKIKTKSNKNQNKINDTISISLSNSISSSNNNYIKEIYKESFFENEDLDKTFKEYLKMRYEKKCKATPTTIKSLIKKLNKYEASIAIEMLQNSIDNGYQGVFELKADKPIKKENVPEWFGKEIKEDKLSAEEEAKLKESLKKFS